MKKTRKSSIAELKDKIEESELSDERAAQVNSVLRIISESIEKLKISLILPKIFEDPKTLRRYLSTKQYEECLQNLDAYLKDAKNQKISMEPSENFRLIRIIDMFQENYKMVELLPEYMDALSQDDKNLLESFRLLYTITAAHLKKSAASELSKEKIIHKIYHENEAMKKNILEFQKKLRNQKINLRWKIAAKDGVIQKYEESLAYKKWDNNIRIQQEIAKSTRAIRAIHSASLTRQKEMEEELGKLKANYDKVLKNNLHQEKHARDEKYDLSIGQIYSITSDNGRNMISCGNLLNSEINVYDTADIQPEVVVEECSTLHPHDSIFDQHDLEECVVQNFNSLIVIRCAAYTLQLSFHDEKCRSVAKRLRTPTMQKNLVCTIYFLQMQIAPLAGLTPMI